MTMISPNQLPAGRELDALIAEHIFGKPPTRDKSGWDTCLYLYFDGECDGRCFYSTNIASAWKIVEEMDRRGFLVTVRPGECVIDGNISVEINSQIWSPLAHWVEESTPLAICRAALKVVLTTATLELGTHHG